MVFYAKIGSELGAFDITDVLNGICDKVVAIFLLSLLKSMGCSALELNCVR